MTKILKESAVARWGILLLVSLVMAANYYFYDALSPLKSILPEKLGFSSTDYGTIVGFYSFPNTFLLMAILGGIILDKIGIRITGFVFVVFMVIGAYATVYGTTEYFGNGGWGYHFLNSFWTGYSPQMKMMSLGMLLFGLGAETSIVVISKIMVKWFKGKEIALAFGINLGIARIGSALAFLVGPRTMVPSWNTPIWIAVILISISLLAYLVYIMYDLKLDKQIKQEQLLGTEEEFRFADFVKLIKNKSFIYITFLCVTFYSAVFPFLKYATDFFFNKYQVPLKTAGDIASWLPLGTILFTPFFAWLVDKKGWSASLMIAGSAMLVLVHLLFATTLLNPYVLIFLLGIAFSLVPAAMWPAVAKIVSESKLGTAYGTMFSLQNLGLFAVPIITGIILDRTNAPGAEILDYTPAMYMFAGFGVLGLVFAFLLKKEDKTSGYGLEKPSNIITDKLE